MKRTNPESKPVLSICLIVRNAAATLEACLLSVRERAPEAEIVIVDTMSNDWGSEFDGDGLTAEQRIAKGFVPKTVHIAKQYADVFTQYKGPKGTWTESMYAFDDAAAARNESFRLASGEWLMWIDADDVLPGAEEAERLLKLNGRWQPPAARVVAAEAKPVSLVEYLAQCAVKFPELEGFYAPYLYWADEHGLAKTWQTRERIVRNNGQWRWQRAAHEVLVPKDPERLRRLDTFAHLLFKHTKQFTLEDQRFSLERHHAILKKQHEAGTASCQDYLYLANYAQFLERPLESEYVNRAYELAYTAIDRARVQVVAGNLAKKNGFFFDAQEAYAAAAALDPTFPDAPLAMAMLLEEAERYYEAGEWYEKGTQCPPGHPLADTTPRDQALKYRLKGALVFMEAARRLTLSGGVDAGIAVATRALALGKEALEWPGLGPDTSEMSMWFGVIENEARGLTRMKELRVHWLYLAQNDETQKAMAVAQLVPHNQQNHPFVTQELKPWLVKMQAHLTDPQAYADFYEGLQEADGVVPSKEDALTVETTVPRVGFLARWLQAHRPTADVLEVGSFDGNVAIPVMRYCPDVKYTAVEAQTRAIERFVERAKRFGVIERLKVHHGALTADDASALVQLRGKFDAVVLFEVIEHVQDVMAVLADLMDCLKPDGRLFLSTPWGAFDRGHPAEGEKREPRGHVRAMMPKDLIAAVERAGGVVEELGGCHADGNYGDTLHLRVKRASGPAARHRPALEFYVPSALWPWNASYVKATGIGASEETIVNLAAGLADECDVTVRAPLPRTHFLFDEEVVDCVKYRPNEALADVNPRATIVVSRSPSMGRVLDPKGVMDKLLWLQDAGYPDLNPGTAADYRKVVVLSEWHKQRMHEAHEVPLAKMEVIPNFLLAEHFNVDAVPKREPHRFIYSSSPDRGLITLLKMWPAILERWPDATLGIFYGWEGCMKLGGLNPAWQARYRPLRQEFLKLREQKGVEEHGRVNHARIAWEMQRASVWGYPTDFEETFCSNAVKARAAGCVPVCTPLAALNESAVSDLTEFVPQSPAFEKWTADFIDGVHQALLVGDVERARMSQEAIERYRLEAVLPLWKALL